MGLFKKKSLYGKSLMTFTILLSILGLIFLGYVFNSMVVYERNLVDNYIGYLAESGELTESISDNLFKVSKYEKKNVKITDGVKELLKSDDLNIKKNSKLSGDGVYAYDLKINNKLISTVSLKSKNSYTQMAILKIDEWEVVDIKTYFDNGLYSYDITVPVDHKVYINDVELSSDDISYEGDVKGLDRLTKHVEISESKTYDIDNLVYDPKIKIVNKDNKEVSYEKYDNKVVVGPKFKEFNTLEEAKGYIKDDFDILELAENWSLFLTDDLKGSYHGFNKLTPYLIEDTYMYQMAYNWSHNVDITFVSNHRLKNPVFTNESIKNFIIYNDNAFSCEVYLEKNMVVLGKDKVDIMHDRLYFVYYDGGYKLVDMESIEK